VRVKNGKKTGVQYTKQSVNVLLFHPQVYLTDTVNRNMHITQENSFTQHDHQCMQQARALAQRSLRFEEVPVGALIVNEEGIILGRGYNKVEKRQSQLAHAEIQAIQPAVKNHKGWRLEKCTLYVTLEPCMMCLGAALLSRIGTIIYGAPSHLFGLQAITSTFPPVYQAHTIIRQGLQQDECSDMLKNFFYKIRSTQEVPRER